jgi:hypothetical protein
MSDRVKQNKPIRYARCEYLTKRSGVSWNATAECGGGTCQGRLKKYYLQGGDFFKPLVIPLQVCFCGTKEAIDEGRFTCVFFAEALNK